MKYVIVGQSVTAIKFIEQLRLEDQESEVSVIAFDKHLPAFPEKFLELISHRIQRNKVVYQNENFYRNLRVEFISEKKISRINFSRRTVFFEDKSRLDADVIIIAGAEKACFPDIKGANKSGVFSMHNYQQVNDLVNMINRIDTIVIESQTLAGVLMAQALMIQEKEVILCIPSDCIAPDVFCRGISDLLILLLEQQGVRIIRNATVREVLGEQDAKAARLSIGKVIAAEVVIFPDAPADMRFYERGGLKVQDRIVVDEYLRTNCDGVFAVDEMSCGFLPLADRERFRQDQVKRLLAALQQKTLEKGEDLNISFQFEISGHNITVIGRLAVPDSTIFFKNNEQGFLGQQIVLENNVVQGVVLIDNENRFEQWKDVICSAQHVDPATHELFAGCVSEPHEYDEQAFEQRDEESQPPADQYEHENIGKIPDSEEGRMENQVENQAESQP